MPLKGMEKVEDERILFWLFLLLSKLPSSDEQCSERVEARPLESPYSTSPEAMVQLLLRIGALSATESI
ncbi:unnamed protein product [Allacma fusca]|uniref:Uncharacterized protein n=1 Tax=Allacma fusca TaxID=39272 RepID=A0A8J2LA41_9HEXA|nr:unnamed protein product [Allacma fusca]